MKRMTLFLMMVVVAGSLRATTFMTQKEALASAFPKGTELRRETIFLSPEQKAEAERLGGVRFEDELIIRYAALRNGSVVGWAYFDAHRVRTLPETLMILVTPDARIERIEILSFSEPVDYLPKERWLDQLDGHKLDDELSLHRAIRPITGASLSGRAIVQASRKVLAIHRVIGTR